MRRTTNPLRHSRGEWSQAQLPSPTATGWRYFRGLSCAEKRSWYHARPLPTSFLQVHIRMTLVGVSLLATPLVLFAQNRLSEQTPLESSFDQELLRDLPTSSNVFALLEAAHAQISSDRFYTGGL